MFLTDDQYTRLRSRFTDWKEAGYPDIDLGLAPLLEQFNTLPGVVTVSSCTGHHRGTPRVKIPFYVYLGVTEQGHTVMQQVYQQLAVRLLEVTRIYLQDLEHKKGGQPSHVQVPYKDVQLTCSFTDTQLEEGEVFTYYRMALYAKGTHLGTVKSNFLTELIATIERVRAAATAAAPITSSTS